MALFALECVVVTYKWVSYPLLAAAAVCSSFVQHFLQYQFEGAAAATRTNNEECQILWGTRGNGSGRGIGISFVFCFFNLYLCLEKEYRPPGRQQTKMSSLRLAPSSTAHKSSPPPSSAKDQ
jgi:hypothetical protein